MSDPSATVRAVLVGDVLLVHGGAEPFAALTGVAARLPADPDRTPVLCSSAVSERPDLFGLLADLLPRHLGGSAVGVRLVPLGRYADPDAVPGLAAGLATDLGIDGSVPLDAPAVSTRAVPVARRWIRAAGGPVRPEEPPAAWRAPLPDPPRPLDAPGPSRPVDAPGPSRPVDAPGPSRPVDAPGPSRAGTPEGWQVTRVGDGYTWLPVPSTADPEPARPDPEPARPGPPRPAAGAATGRPPLPPAAAGPPPGRAIPGGWSFLDVEEPRRSDPEPLDVFLVEVAIGAGGFRVDGRPVPPGVLAGHLAAGWLDGRPVALRGGGPYPAVAGMLFGALADALARPVIASDDRVEVTATGLLTTPGTFRRWHPRGPAGTARLVHDLGPVLPPPASTVAAPPPASTVAAPVLAAGGSAAAVDAALVPPDVARRWQGFRAPGLDLLRIGPAPADPPGPAADPRVEQPGPASAPSGASAGTDPLEPGPQVGPPGPDPGAGAAPPAPTAPAASGAAVDAAPPAGDGEPAPGRAPAPPTGPARVPTPWRPDGRALAADDRAALRRILAGRYDAYTQVVTRTLAEEPGLRVAAMSAPDLPAGLVAVRAYCAGERATVNAALRDGVDPDPAADPALLARWIAYGLRRLPAVFGPVFRAVTALPEPGYRPGTVLVEPAFLDVDPVPPVVPDGGAELVIWSTGARRLGGLAAAGVAARGGPAANRAAPRADAGSPAVFPAGTCFEVLALEPTGVRDPRRVFLRELPPGRAATAGEQTLARLRSAAGAEAGATATTAPLAVAPGFDPAGRLFAPPDGAGPGDRRGAAAPTPEAGPPGWAQPTGREGGAG
ncbi:hypothetical protein [Micromonospora sp. WMMD712]|uniref:hypothetical protein n=1 Tax=Micromonospora sp. WMMD712 TaxID=3016096 RepID=UPI00249CEB1C|nr:hypothetical protein [Micromonospora sp. WMMD712]WFE61231.1 hypothetical protein O7633_32220 [Micromonospora sp. WMMD712]